MVQVMALLLVRGMTYSVPSSTTTFSMSSTAPTKPEGSLGWVPPSTSMESPSFSYAAQIVEQKYSKVLRYCAVPFVVCVLFGLVTLP